MKRLLPFALLLAACFPKGAPPPGALSPKQVELAKVKDANVTDEQLEHGRTLFVSKCGECHDHPDLTLIKLSKWPGIMTDMVEKADLDKDAAGKADVTVFVLTAAEAAGAPQ